MGLSRPDAYKDKSNDWYSYWSQRRRRELAGLISEAVIEEHRANPTGYRQPHSPALQQLLNYLRTQPVAGKYFIYAAEPWHDYRIAMIEPAGAPIRLLDERVFQTEEEAMHAVFLLRVGDLQAAVKGAGK